MLSIRTILVPVDFSGASKQALRYGAALGTRFGSRLAVAHVVPLPVPTTYLYPVEIPDIEQRQIEEIRTRLGEFAAGEAEGLETRFIVETGDIQDKLIETADEERADLIVMGTHGRRPFERWLLGSVTERILRRTHAPLLSVAELDPNHEIGPSESASVRRLLYAIDLTETSGVTMNIALDLARAFDAELTVLHVLEQFQWAYGMEFVPPDIGSARRRLRESLEKQLEDAVPDAARREGRARTVLIEGVPYRAILKAADDENADMILLNTRTKTGLERALLGTNAERVVRGAHIPVLSIPVQPGSNQARP